MWLATYMDKVVTAINNHRGYAQKQIMKPCQKWMGTHNDKMPFLSKLQACMDRTLGLSTDENMEYAEF